MYNVDMVLSWIEAKLTDKRYKHSVAVMETAVKLAVDYGVEPYKAQYAGAAHDCAKWMTNDQLISFCHTYDIEVDNVCMVQPELLHGGVGAEIARREFGVEDEDILNAIHYHTTGRRNMSMLEKIVYISDLVEPYRDFPGVDEIRSVVNNDIDNAVFKGIECSLKRVLSRGNMIHPNSIDAWNNMISKQRAKY